MHIAPNTAAAQTPSIGVVSIETGGRQREDGQYRQQREQSTLSPSDPFAGSCFKQTFFGKHRKKNSTLFFEPPPKPYRPSVVSTTRRAGDEVFLLPVLVTKNGRPK